MNELVIFIPTLIVGYALGAGRERRKSYKATDRMSSAAVVYGDWRGEQAHPTPYEERNTE